MVADVHPGFVTAVVFDPARDALLSASVDGGVNVWDAGTGDLRARWRCHTGPVNALAVDRREGHLLTAGHDRTVAVWRLDDGRQVRRLTGLRGGALDAVTVGRRIATACVDGTIAVWDGAGVPQVLDGHAEAVTSLYALADDLLVSGARDRTVRVWDLSTGRSRTLTGHRFWVTRVGAAGGGDVVTAGEDGRIIRWAGSGTAAAWTLDVVREPIWGLGCDRMGHRAVAGAAGATWLVDLEAGTAERLDDLGSATFRAIAVAPDDRTVALGDDSGRLLLYDLDARAVRATLCESGPGYLSVAASAPDRAVVGRADGGVELVTGASRTVVEDAHGVFVYSARRLDADRFATGGFDGVVRVWNLATAARARIVYGSLAFSLSVSVAADRLLVTGGDRMAVWDIDAPEESWADDAEGTGSHSFGAIDAAGRRIAAVGEDELLRIVWPGQADVVAWTLPDDCSCGVEWVPLPGGGPERSVAVATPYGRVRVVDVATGDCRTLHGDHEDWIRQLRVSPDGRYVASTSQNGIGRVFDLHHGRPVAQNELVGRVVAALDITPDGDLVALSSTGELSRLDLERAPH